LASEFDCGKELTAYDPKNRAICHFFAAYDKRSGYWTTLVLPFLIEGGAFSYPIILSKIGQDFIVSGVATVGKSVIGYWPAGAMKPSTTNGAAPLVWDESGTNDVMTGYLAFDAAAVEYAQFSFKAPQGLDEGTMTATFEWYEAAGASTHVCVWQIEMLALADADTIDTAWGTAVTVSDTGTSGTFRISPETGAITPGNTWAAGDEIFVRVSRLATDGSDTLDVDAKLMGVHINATYTTLIEP